MRYALRVDANQTPVIRALEAAGATVLVIGQPVDLLVGIGGKFAFFEVKDGSKPPSARKKTKVQELFWDMFPGYPICLVDSPECAVRHLKVLQA